MRIQIIAAFILVIVLLTPQALGGCGKWVVRTPETDFLEDPTFDEAVKSSTGLTATVKGTAADDDGGEGAEDDAKDSADTKAEASASKTPSVEVPDVSGNWQVRMENLTGCTLNLILIQSKDRLQGYGSLEENGIEIPATAMGSVSDDAANLDIKLVKDGSLNKEDRQYKLSMALEEEVLEEAEGTLLGRYEYYLSDEFTSEGKATATRS
ncbi:MAG: hypothetical protein QUS09_07950 [Methanotrichaceae archaeon]|nr:hypothetical protein [Methanotrichaceae archaeon]